MAVGAAVLRLLFGRVKRLLRSGRLRLRHKRYVQSTERGTTELVIRAGATEKSLLSVSEPPDRGGLVTSGQVSSDPPPGVSSAGKVDNDSKRPAAALSGPAWPAGPGVSGPGPRTLRVPPSWPARPAASTAAAAPPRLAGDVSRRPVRPSDVTAARQHLRPTARTAIDTSSEQPPTDAMDETDRVIQLERRNADLQRELADVQDKLSTSRAERDDIGIKYSALTDRLDRMMKPGDDALTYDTATSRSTTSARPNTSQANAIDTIGRGRRLEEENQAFRRRLETYQESQKQQAQVVAQLQDKVNQYKQRCAQLEDRMTDSGRRLAAADQRAQERLQTTVDRDHALDLETALVRLEEAENRCVTLSDVNALLREQLDAAQEANEALTGEIQKLTADWQRLRDEMEHKELDWKEEEQTFNEYYNAEHARMLKLWKEIVGFRRDFSDLKLGTERDLGRVRSEMARLARQTADACTTVNVSGGGAEQPTAAGSAPAVRKQVSQMSAAFGNASMWEKMQDIQKQEATFRVKKREMETKIKDISNQLDMSKSELVEKEKMVVSLNKMVHTLETSTAELSQKLEASRLVSEENEVLSQAIREVAQLVVEDSERGPEADDKVTVLVKSTSLARDLQNLLNSTNAGRLQCSSESAKAANKTPTPAPRQGIIRELYQNQDHPPSPSNVPSKGYMDGLAWRSPQDYSTLSSQATPTSPNAPSTPFPSSTPGSVSGPNTMGYMEGLAWHPQPENTSPHSIATPSTAGTSATALPKTTTVGAQPSPADPTSTSNSGQYMTGLAGRSISVSSVDTPSGSTSPTKQFPTVNQVQPNPTNPTSTSSGAQYMTGLAGGSISASSVDTPLGSTSPTKQFPTVNQVQPSPTNPTSTSNGGQYMTGLVGRSISASSVDTPSGSTSPTKQFPTANQVQPSPTNPTSTSNSGQYMTGLAGGSISASSVDTPSGSTSPAKQCPKANQGPIAASHETGYMTGLALRSPKDSASVSSTDTPSSPAVPSTPLPPYNQGTFQSPNPSGAGYMEGLAWRPPEENTSASSIATPSSPGVSTTPLSRSTPGTVSTSTHTGYMAGLAWRSAHDNASVSSIATPATLTASPTPQSRSTPGAVAPTGYMEGLAWGLPQDYASASSIATPATLTASPTPQSRLTPGAVAPTGYMEGLAWGLPQGNASAASIATPTSSDASTTPHFRSTPGPVSAANPTGYMEGLAWRPPQDYASASSIATPATLTASPTPQSRSTPGAVAPTGYMEGLAWGLPQGNASASSIDTPSTPSQSTTPLYRSTPGPASAPNHTGYMEGLAWRPPEDNASAFSIATPTSSDASTTPHFRSSPGPVSASNPTGYMEGLAWRPPQDYASASSTATPSSPGVSLTPRSRATPGAASAANPTGGGYMDGLAWRSPHDSPSASSPATPSSPAVPATPIHPYSTQLQNLPNDVPAEHTSGYMSGLAWCSQTASVSGAAYMAGPEMPVSQAQRATDSGLVSGVQYMAGLAWKPATSTWEVATPGSGETTPFPHREVGHSGGGQGSIFVAPAGSSTATPLSGGATPAHGTNVPGSDISTPGSGTATPTAAPRQGNPASTEKSSDTPPWEVATPESGASGAASPVASRTSALAGMFFPMLSPLSLPTLGKPSWPSPGTEMESGVGAGPGSESQPPSRPPTARRRSELQAELAPKPDPEPEPEPEPEPGPGSSKEPSMASVAPEESPVAEEPSAGDESGKELVKAPSQGSKGCCSLS